MFKGRIKRLQVSLERSILIKKKEIPVAFDEHTLFVKIIM